MNFESQFVHCDYDYDYKVWPEVYLLLINLLICLLTANYQLYKVLNHVLNHKMMKNEALNQKSTTNPDKTIYERQKIPFLHWLNSEFIPWNGKIFEFSKNFIAIWFGI